MFPLFSLLTSSSPPSLPSSSSFCSYSLPSLSDSDSVSVSSSQDWVSSTSFCYKKNLTFSDWSPTTAVSHAPLSSSAPHNASDTLESNLEDPPQIDRLSIPYNIPPSTSSPHSYFSTSETYIPVPAVARYWSGSLKNSDCESATPEATDLIFPSSIAYYPTSTSLYTSVFTSKTHFTNAPRYGKKQQDYIKKCFDSWSKILLDFNDPSTLGRRDLKTELYFFG